MGCDIHAHLEIKVDGEWLYYAPVAIDRCYELFASMADCGRCRGIDPIAPNRGLPKDMTRMTKLHAEDWGADGHSHSWLNEKEIQEIAKVYEYIYDERWVHGFLGVNRIYLFGNTVDGRSKYPEDYEHISFVEDIRLIFWFDN